MNSELHCTINCIASTPLLHPLPLLSSLAKRRLRTDRQNCVVRTWLLCEGNEEIAEGPWHTSECQRLHGLRSYRKPERSFVFLNLGCSWPAISISLRQAPSLLDHFYSTRYTCQKAFVEWARLPYRTETYVVPRYTPLRTCYYRTSVLHAWCTCQALPWQYMRMANLS